MDVELRLSDLYTVVAIIIAAALAGFGVVGQRVTPVSESGEPRFLTWSDWRLLQAEQQWEAEASVLQNDVADMLVLLNSAPNPAAAQMLVERVENHTRTGQAALANARQAVYSAALKIRDWSVGVLDRESAIQSVQDAIALLQPGR
jgi:hypothetical protein